MKLTIEQKNIKIAEALGWREAFPANKEPHPETRRGGILLPYEWVNEVTHERVMSLPNQFTDLNAASEAWKALICGKEIHKTWRAYLQMICLRDAPTIGYNSTTNATAAQRSEATGLSLGLWKKGE